MVAATLRLGLTLLVGVVIGSSSGADDAERQVAGRPQPPLEEPPPEKLEAIAARDAERLLVLLAPDRPVFIRLRLVVDDQSLVEAGEQSMRELFQLLDLDNDGVLSVTERATDAQQTTSAPGPFNALAKFFAGATAAAAGQSAASPSFDAAAFRQEFQRGHPALTLLNSSQSNPLAYLSDLFQMLDEDGNGRLSRDELTQATRLLRLDFDGNRVLTLREPSRVMNPFMNQFRQTGAYTGVELMANAAATPEASAMRILDRYRSRDASPLPEAPAPPVEDPAAESSPSAASVTAAGLPLAALCAPGEPPETSERYRPFDSNHDESLDEFEWAALLANPPIDVEVAARVSRPYQDDQPRPTPDSARQAEVRVLASHVPVRTRGQSVWIGAGGAELQISVDGNQFDALGQVKRQFMSLDRDNNDYVDRNESRQDFYVSQVFPVADADGDGKLFRQELDAYLARQRAELGCQIEASVSELGQHLFSLLDADRDQRIDEAELRQGVERATPLDRDGDGALSASELPPAYRVSLNFARPAFLRQVFFSDSTVDTPLPGASGLFGKLDRNRDGRVSRREFPGATALFERLDANHDGSLQAEELASSVPNKP